VQHIILNSCKFIVTIPVRTTDRQRILKHANDISIVTQEQL